MPLAANNLSLFALCVAIWSTTWFAITFQLGMVAPEVSVAWRFLFAALLIASYCRVRGISLRYRAADHAALALLGIAMYSAGYICVYRAEEYLASGLVAVGFSASPLLAMFGLRFFFGQPLTARMAAGSLLGIVGIVLVFWPEVARLSQGEGVVYGALLTLGAVIVAVVGGLLPPRNHPRAPHCIPTTAWARRYGGQPLPGRALPAGTQLRSVPPPE